MKFTGNVKIHKSTKIKYGSKYKWLLFVTDTNDTKAMLVYYSNIDTKITKELNKQFAIGANIGGNRLSKQ